MPQVLHGVAPGRARESREGRALGGVREQLQRLLVEAEAQALQRELESVQAEVAVQKLSERNCIEIVNTLCELGEIDLIYTQVQYSTHGTARRRGVTARHVGSDKRTCMNSFHASLSHEWDDGFLSVCVSLSLSVCLSLSLSLLFSNFLWIFCSFGFFRMGRSI